MSEKGRAVFGLVDCNNFYVSCERVFQPNLDKRPVIVLSNGDGCVVSRSDEAKALNIKMGDPLFKIKDLIKKYNVKVISSNFGLYGNISKRIMQIIKELVPAYEVYSIDEAFLDLTGFNTVQLDTLSKNLVQTIWRCTGIPVSLGIGSTKTLAKVANHVVKRDKAMGPIFIINSSNKDQILSSVEIQDVWGIGRSWTCKLSTLGIKTAYDLTQQNYLHFKRLFNKVLASIILELNDISVLNLQTDVKPKKQIMVSRSFGKGVDDYNDLRQAIATYTTKAIAELRSQNSVAKEMCVFLQTSRFSSAVSPYHREVTIKLPIASNDTSNFLSAALNGLKRIYVRGLKYKKVGIIILEISQKDVIQMDLFYVLDSKTEKRMEVLDKINNKMGHGLLRYAVEGFKKPWEACPLYRSPITQSIITPQVDI